MLVKYKDQRSSSDELIQLIESREHDDHYEEKLSYSVCLIASFTNQFILINYIIKI